MTCSVKTVATWGAAVLKLRQHCVRLVVEPDQGVEGHLVAQQLAFDFGVIALDVAGLFQGAHAAQTGRRGDADALCEFDVGDAAFVLQFAQNLQVDFIEFVTATRHYASSSGSLTRFHALGRFVSESPCPGNIISQEIFIILFTIG